MPFFLQLQDYPTLRGCSVPAESPAQLFFPTCTSSSFSLTGRSLLWFTVRVKKKRGRHSENFPKMHLWHSYAANQNSNRNGFRKSAPFLWTHTVNQLGSWQGILCSPPRFRGSWKFGVTAEVGRSLFFVPHRP